MRALWLVSGDEGGAGRCLSVLVAGLAGLVSAFGDDFVGVGFCAGDGDGDGDGDVGLLCSGLFIEA